MEMQISNENNNDMKNNLIKDSEEHKRDVCIVRDFIFWAFQKSYQQQGKSFKETDRLETYN